jgi:two-component system cell cycle response regulator DivK
MYGGDMMKILLVENDDINRTMLTSLIEYHGFSVTSAVDSKVAIEKASLEKPHLILMDNQTPFINGVNVLKVLRDDEVTKDIPVLTMASYASDMNDKRIFDAGFDGYLVKPLSTGKSQVLVESSISECA